MPIHERWELLPSADGPTPLPIDSSIIREIAWRRGIRGGEEWRRFSAPGMGDLHDPSQIHGMDAACERILRAIRDRETILIYGDYDVDGVTSIVLLQTVLRAHGADAGFVVPHRLVDGYGLKVEVIERVLAERNVKLVITVDCGITSVEPVRRTIERGIDVIVTDHHLPPEALPAAAAVLNPRQEGCSYPFKDLAGVGVVFKLCCELIRRSGKKVSIESLLKIAAIGTVADVAPLIGENRTIVRLGLAGLSEVRNPGLRSLIRNAGLFGKPLRASDVGFKLGPRINAAGRLASADAAIRLFHAKDEEEAFPIVAELNRLNAERQRVEAQVIALAEEEIARNGAEMPLLILAGAGWHRGVLGLCASRLAQKYHRPVLMIAIDGDLCVGSGRSIPDVHLHELLLSASDLFTHFGGHDYACGFSFPATALAEVRRRLSQTAAELPPEAFRRRLTLDGELSAREITPALARDHELLEPFGAGNLQPRFLFSGMSAGRRREFSEGCFDVPLTAGGCTVPSVIWPSNRNLVPLFEENALLHVATTVEPDSYSPSGLRLTVIDAAPSSDEDTFLVRLGAERTSFAIG